MLRLFRSDGKRFSNLDYQTYLSQFHIDRLNCHRPPDNNMETAQAQNGASNGLMQVIPPLRTINENPALQVIDRHEISHPCTPDSLRAPFVTVSI